MAFSKFNFIIQIWHKKAKMGDYNAKIGNKSNLIGNMLPNICCQKVAFLKPKQFYWHFLTDKKCQQFGFMKSTPEKNE